jgi:hypothetical protein
MASNIARSLARSIHYPGRTVLSVVVLAVSWALVFHVLDIVLLQKREAEMNGRIGELALYQGSPPRTFEENGRATQRLLPREEAVRAIQNYDLVVLKVSRPVNVAEKITGKNFPLDLYFYHLIHAKKNRSGQFPECTLSGMPSGSATSTVVLDGSWRCRVGLMPSQLAFLSRASSVPFIVFPLDSISEIAGATALDKVERLWLGVKPGQQPQSMVATTKNRGNSVEWHHHEFRSAQGLLRIHRTTMYWAGLSTACILIGIILYYKKERSILQNELFLRMALGHDAVFVAKWYCVELVTQALTVLSISYVVTITVRVALYQGTTSALMWKIVFSFFAVAVGILTLLSMIASRIITKYEGSKYQ